MAGVVTSPDIADVMVLPDYPDASDIFLLNLDPRLNKPPYVCVPLSETVDTSDSLLCSFEGRALLSLEAAPQPLACGVAPVASDWASARGDTAPGGDMDWDMKLTSEDSVRTSRRSCL